MFYVTAGGVILCIEREHLQIFAQCGLCLHIARRAWSHASYCTEIVNLAAAAVLLSAKPSKPKSVFQKTFCKKKKQQNEVNKLFPTVFIYAFIASGVR